MTNFEYWKDKILEITERGDFGLHDGTPIDCYCMTCRGCGFNDLNNRCLCNKTKWLYSEHVDKPKLTKNERQFCELIETGWIVRNRDDKLRIYITPTQPHYNGIGWCADSYYLDIGLLSTIGITLDFDFIEPGENGIWNIKDLLSLEVED